MLIRNPDLLRRPCADVSADNAVEVTEALTRALLDASITDLLRSITAPEVGLPVRAFGVREGKSVTVYLNPRMVAAVGEITRFPIGAPYTGGRGYWLRGFPEIVIAHSNGRVTFSRDDAAVAQHDLGLLAGLPVVDLGPEMERILGEPTGDQRAAVSYLADINLSYPRLERNAPCWCMSEKKWKRCHGLGL